MSLFSFTRVVALFTLGFFVSCSTPQEYLNMAEQLNAKKYSNAVQTVENVLKKKPNDPEARYYHIFALNEWARNTKLAYERYPIYERFMESFYIADSIWAKDKRRGSLRKLHELRLEAWTREYNETVRLTEANRNGSISDWLAVFEATENAQLLNPDSIQVIPAQLESLVKIDDWIGVDSVIAVHDSKLKAQPWFEARKIQSALHKGDIRSAESILSSSQNWYSPNDFTALMLSNEQNLDTLIHQLGKYLPQGKPSRAFYLLTAHTFWKTLETNHFVDTTQLYSFYKNLGIKNEEWQQDSLFLLKKARIIDKALSSIEVNTLDSYLTHTKAILFTNIASKIIEHEREEGIQNEIAQGQAEYYFKKAAPELNLLIYQFNENAIENAKVLIQIYDWLDEPYRADELRKEFNLN